MTAALPATSHGWLLRPELDTPAAVAWELPAGTVLFVPRGCVPVVARDGAVVRVGTREAGDA